MKGFIATAKRITGIVAMVTGLVAAIAAALAAFTLEMKKHYPDEKTIENEGSSN